MSAYSRNEMGVIPKQDWSKKVEKEAEEVDPTVDSDPIDLRFCPDYIKGYKCAYGEACKMKHMLPREQFIECIDFKDGICHRQNCIYLHPGTKQKKYVPDPEAPMLYESTASVFKRYLSLNKNVEEEKASNRQ